MISKARMQICKCPLAMAQAMSSWHIIPLLKLRRYSVHLYEEGMSGAAHCQILNFPFTSFILSLLTQVSLAQKIDDSNAVTGGINLKTGVQDYKWLQKRPGTTIETTLCVNPTSSLKELFDLSGKKVSINWKDAGSAGTWSATAQFPLDDFKATKVSIAHMWDI